MISKFKFKNGKIGIAVTVKNSRFKVCGKQRDYLRLVLDEDWDVSCDEGKSIKLSNLINLDKLDFAKIEQNTEKSPNR